MNKRNTWFEKDNSKEFKLFDKRIKKLNRKFYKPVGDVSIMQQSNSSLTGRDFLLK